MRAVKTRVVLRAKAEKEKQRQEMVEDAEFCALGLSAARRYLTLFGTFGQQLNNDSN